MKFAALALAAFMSFASGCAHQSASRDSADTEKELLALHEQWAAARVNGDVDGRWQLVAHQSTRVATSR